MDVDNLRKLAQWAKSQAGLASLNRMFKLEKLQKSARFFSSQAKFKARNKKIQL